MNKDRTNKTRFSLMPCSFIFQIAIILGLLSLAMPPNTSIAQSNDNNTSGEPSTSPPLSSEPAQSNSVDTQPQPSTTSPPNDEPAQSNSNNTPASQNPEFLNIFVDSISPSEPQTGDKVTASGSISVSDHIRDVSEIQITVNWGDDQSDSTVYSDNEGQWTAYHIYNSAGEYTISATAPYEKYPSISSTSQHITVTLGPPPPDRHPIPDASHTSDNPPIGNIPIPKDIQPIISQIIPPKFGYPDNSEIPQLPLIPIIILGIAVLIIAVIVKSRRRRRKLQQSSPHVIEIRTEGGLE
jgi:hypothetical protein